MNDRSLAGRRLPVAGASAGIGRALAVRAVGDGTRVLPAAKLREVCKEAGGGEAVAADLSRQRDREHLAGQARHLLGRIDVLVSCAGLAPLRLLPDTTGEDWERVLGTNVVGVHHLLRACLPVLAQQELMTPEEVAEALAGVIATAAGLAGVGIEHLTLRSPSPVAGTFDSALSLPSADSAPPAEATTPEQGAVHG